MTAAALYVGRMGHRRFETRSHSFSLGVFYVSLDVDDLPASLDRVPFWSGRRPAPIRFRRRDYLDGTDRPLGEVVRELVADRTGTRPAGPIRLVTQLRTFGWLFNPISIYLCLADRPGPESVETIVLEVTNTPWHERHWYVVPVTADRPHGPWEFPKELHVSPFIGMDVTYRLRLRLSGGGERLTLRLEDRRGSGRLFEAVLTLERRDLTARTALTVPLRHPLLTLRTSASIYRHAVRLWTKGVPVHRHPTGSVAAPEREMAGRTTRGVRAS